MDSTWVSSREVLHLQREGEKEGEREGERGERERGGGRGREVEGERTETTCACTCRQGEHVSAGNNHKIVLDYIIQV